MNNELSAVLFVYLINLLGNIPMTNNNDNTTIGFNPKDMDKTTNPGAVITPIKLIDSITPAAIDWIYTEKDSVCKHTINVYPTAKNY